MNKIKKQDEIENHQKIFVHRQSHEVNKLMQLNLH